ncbi:hypothetical protein LOTGIDRAFT_131450 [Lottia gigantea]|uniref:F-box domain-containing protein n=1 Tax=Lottia gigantea TaxID=225164 RepID=V3ZQS7_LOTGI|nr:hypothetical protein LOTGIDRAFT_131450 [Lottia gigantea]ESO84855.1 hypothetical protein LOTGIDRAFT_131450 [Lottia gigantea]
MKNWLNDHGAIVDYTDTAPSPCKDFYHLFITPELVIYRLWKIVPPTRSDSSNPPSEVRDSLEDFQYDERLHSEIQRVGGANTLDYITNICQGKIDYLPRLKENILLKILLMLDLEDLARLGQVSKQFRTLCNSDVLWQKIYIMNSESGVTPDVESLAASIGWKKLFYTNKLQLQVQLRRQRAHE